MRGSLHFKYSLQRCTKLAATWPPKDQLWIKQKVFLLSNITYWDLIYIVYQWDLLECWKTVSNGWFSLELFLRQILTHWSIPEMAMKTHTEHSGPGWPDTARAEPTVVEKGFIFALFLLLHLHPSYVLFCSVFALSLVSVRFISLRLFNPLRKQPTLQEVLSGKGVLYFTIAGVQNSWEVLIGPS